MCQHACSARTEASALRRAICSQPGEALDPVLECPAQESTGKWNVCVCIGPLARRNDAGGGGSLWKKKTCVFEGLRAYHKKGMVMMLKKCTFDGGALMEHRPHHGNYKMESTRLVCQGCAVKATECHVTDDHSHNCSPPQGGGPEEFLGQREPGLAQEVRHPGARTSSEETGSKLSCQKGGGRPTGVEPEEGILLCGTEEALPETPSSSSHVLGMLRELGGTQARGWLTCPTSHWESEVLLKMRNAPFSCTLWKRNPQRFSSDASTGNTTGSPGRDGNRRAKKHQQTRTGK